ncbi:hypothetical protein LSH36_97g07028 [Paralvinella palmiformis]|uniref:Uncharacterized protein n=1 Tax=Paralvinella palmiformis TaxID=53620 RepID=A0AAD9K0C3_9ANNE|nr:hypothetical protein LSH36_97g07028 [Paralvinella palmiformis]
MKPALISCRIWIKMKRIIRDIGLLSFRYYVLFHLPNLKFLDSTPVKREEKLEAKQRGQFLKVIKPAEDVIVDKSDELLVCRYTPLPKSIREQPDHKATFGRCKYVYYGRHSEGNRFIRNKDL